MEQIAVRDVIAKEMLVTWKLVVVFVMLEWKVSTAINHVPTVSTESAALGNVHVTLTWNVIMSMVIAHVR